MAGSGSPILTVDGTGRRIAVVASSWHDVIMAALVDNAVSTLEDAGAAATVVRVPGTFELPVACRRFAGHFDGLVALGVVIRGGTPHFDYVCAGATHGLTEVAVRTCTPIGFGVLTCDDEEQAIARAGLPGSVEDKGFEAATAAIATVMALRSVH